jgi:hypothetical protein
MATNDSFRFPSTHHLNIVSRKNVLALDRNGLRTVYTSVSGGIMAAKESVDGSGTLAIADSFIVLLHHVEKGLDASHKLKSTQVKSPQHLVTIAN